MKQIFCKTMTWNTHLKIQQLWLSILVDLKEHWIKWLKANPSQGHTWYISFFYTGRIFDSQNLHPKTIKNTPQNCQPWTTCAMLSKNLCYCETPSLGQAKCKYVTEKVNLHDSRESIATVALRSTKETFSAQGSSWHKITKVCRLSLFSLIFTRPLLPQGSGLQI